MRVYLLALILLLGPLVGCATINTRYSIEVRRPVPEVCFIVIQWQTDWDRSKEWKEKVMRMARQAIEKELERLGLPRHTIDVGSPTMYEGGSWVAVRATAGNMSKPELEARAGEILDAVPPGKYLPAPIYRGKGEFALGSANATNASPPEKK